MTTKSQQFKALRYRYTVEGKTYFIQKGGNKYSHWYVLDENYRYLTKGASSQTAAVSELAILAAKEARA
jgi:hypothetical protein